MFFSESSKVIHLKSGDDTYHLNIKSGYQNNNGNKSDNIYLNITIVKMMNQNKYQADTIELIYSLKTRTYSTFQKVNGLGSLLYASIIKLLNETYCHT